MKSRCSTNLLIPEGAAALRRNRDIDGALSEFEKLLGIPDVRVEAYSPTQPKERITFRHVLPFLLQDDSTIIDKSRLFWMGDDKDRDQKRTAFINRLPFFLGAVDLELVTLEAELKRLKRELALVEQRVAEAQRLRGEEASRARALLAEAVSVGLADPPPDNARMEDLTERLETIRSWVPLTSTERGLETNTMLASLYEQQRHLNAELSQLKARVRSAENLAGLSDQFSQSSSSQRDRLEVVTLIPTEETIASCPTCAQPLETVATSVVEIRGVYERVRRELAQVERQRPRLIQRVEALQEEVVQRRHQLEQVKQQIAAVVQEDEEAKRRLNLDQRRHWVIGRISLYLDTLNPEQVSNISDSDLEVLRRRVETLEDQVSTDAKREALEERRILISQNATNIVNRLPFDERYRNAQVDFNPRDLSVGVITARRRESMRNIGSDENYLSLHLSVMLALHRYFAQAERPVPGVLLLDQLSRPYFPQDIEEEVEINANDRERDALKRYFDLLFDEVERGESLQLIVLEHAYLVDDERFRKATKERWIDGKEFLVPSDWPEEAA